MKDVKNISARVPSLIREALGSSAAVREVFVGLLCLTGAFCFGGAECVMQTYPLGIAFFCALRKYLPYTAAGLCLSAVLGEQNAAVYLSGYVIAAFFRLGLHYVLNNRARLRISALHDSLIARICSCCAGTLTISLIRIIYNGLRYYDLIASVFLMGAGAFMVWIYSLICDAENRYTKKYEAGLAALFFSVVLALRPTELLGMSAGIFAAFILTVYTARCGGALRGAVTGFLCGAAIDIAVCPMFGIIGFVCGLLTPLASYFGVIVSLCLGIAAGMYIGGADILYYYIPEAALAAAVYLPLDYLKLLPGVRVYRDDIRYSEAVSVTSVKAKEHAAEYKRRVDNLADTLESLSELFTTLSNRERRPAVHEICSMCENEWSAFCKKCPSKAVCFGKKPVRGSADIRRVAEAIYQKGVLTAADIPERIRTNCYFVDRITMRVNIGLTNLNTERQKNNKTEIIAEDYGALAGLLSEFSERTEEENSLNEEMTARVRENTVYRDLFADNVAVWGKRKVSVLAGGVDTSKIRMSAREIKKSFEVSLSVKLGDVSFTQSGAYTIMSLSRRRVLSCETGVRDRVRDSELVNGDTSFSLSCANDKYYVCICDGMGSGREAALTSKLSAAFLQKLLSAGCKTDNIMDMLNHFIRSKTCECFTTVDLLEIDMLTCRARFVKSGASESFVLRDGKIFKIASHTPPVGIMKQLCAESVEFDFRGGDTVVMLSDGVYDASDEPVWLYNLLTYEAEEDCGEFAEKIIDRAQTLGVTCDDMTVSVTKLSSI